MFGISPVYSTIILLLLSNIFMTFAWYGHLKHLKGSAIYVAILVSWGIAFFEYMLMVPANRIGHTELSLAQLKIMQAKLGMSDEQVEAIKHQMEEEKQISAANKQ